MKSNKIFAFLYNLYTNLSWQEVQVVGGSNSEPLIVNDVAADTAKQNF